MKPIGEWLAGVELRLRDRGIDAEVRHVEELPKGTRFLELICDGDLPVAVDEPRGGIRL